MIDFSKHVDSHGMLGKIWHSESRESGGDSAQRMGMFHSGLKFSNYYKIPAQYRYADGPKSFEDSISGLFRQNGTWRRHPDEKRWYGDWDRMSRDQMIPIIVALGCEKRYGVLTKTFLNHLICRGLLFMTNTRRNWATPANHKTPDPDGDLYNYDYKMPDVTLFEFWALYLRALPFHLGYIGLPVLLVADIFTAIGGLIRNKNKDKDVLNHCIIAVNATVNCPTPISWLGNKLTDWALMAKKLTQYFKPVTGDPPLDKLWIPIIEKL